MLKVIRLPKVVVNCSLGKIFLLAITPHPLIIIHVSCIEIIATEQDDTLLANLKTGEASAASSGIEVYLKMIYKCSQIIYFCSDLDLSVCVQTCCKQTMKTFDPLEHIYITITIPKR